MVLASVGAGAGMAATAASAAPPATAVPATAPGYSLMPIQGAAYQPTPSNYEPCGSCAFYDTDFYNSDFSALWSTANGGRGDLATLAADGVNLLHLYDWNPSRNHLPFLNEANADGIKVAVPVSDYFVAGDANEAADIASILGQVYVDANGNASTTPHPGVGMITIANEYDLNGITPGQIAQAAADVVAAEQALGATTLLPIAVPVSFGIDPTLGSSTVPAVNATQAVLTAYAAQPGLPANFVSTRVIAATNPQNAGSYLTSGLPGGESYYAAFSAAIPNVPLWFSELGTGEVAACQAAGDTTACATATTLQQSWNAGQWAAAPPGAGGILLGSAQFEFQDEPWKTGGWTPSNATAPTAPFAAFTPPAWTFPGPSSPANDSTFGMYTISGGETPTSATTTSGQTYLVDTLAAKPALSAMQSAFSVSSTLVTASAAAATTRAGGPTARPLDSRDVYALDRAHHRWSVRFDGATAGLARGNAIRAFTVAPDGSYLMTLAHGQRLPGLGAVPATAIVRYAPKAKRFSVALRGAGRDVDAIAVTPRGRIEISRTGSSDLLARSGGRWRTVLRGADLGLSAHEDVDAAWIDPHDGAIYLSTGRAFAAEGLRGGADDVVVARRAGRGWQLSPAFYGTLNGLAGANVTGFALGR